MSVFQAHFGEIGGSRSKAFVFGMMCGMASPIFILPRFERGKGRKNSNLERSFKHVGSKLADSSNAVHAGKNEPKSGK
jgi:hypothetical protein